MTEHMQVEGRTDDPAEQQSLMEEIVEEQTIAEPAAEEATPAPTEDRAVPGPSVNLDEAEQQVAEWRREDEALLGEAPEVAPASAAGQVPPPAVTEEAEVAALRKEDEALLGEAPEATPVPTTNESQL